MPHSTTTAGEDAIFLRAPNSAVTRDLQPSRDWRLSLGEGKFEFVTHLIVKLCNLDQLWVDS